MVDSSILRLTYEGKLVKQIATDTESMYRAAVDELANRLRAFNQSLLDESFQIIIGFDSSSFLKLTN